MITKKIKVGCCGWNYFNCKDYFGNNWKEKFKSKLQAYTSIFNICELNSSFYRIPKIDTARRWREEADEINPTFEFTVKANQLITHEIVFGKRSVAIFNSMKEICEILRTKVVLLQTPASFKANDENVNRMREFFGNIDRENLILVWESRGTSWTEEKVKEVCQTFDLVDCVDPLRRNPLWFSSNNTAYFRLHGFGKPSMYNYNFSDEELKKLKKMVEELKKVKEVYVLFNNREMYKNALHFT